MNDQSKQPHMSWSEERQDLEEADLDKVTGGMDPKTPWNYPFDSGTASTTPSSAKTVSSVSGRNTWSHTSPALRNIVSEALDGVNTEAVKGNRVVAKIQPLGDIVYHKI
jgi:hypothetical protein